MTLQEALADDAESRAADAARRVRERGQPASVGLGWPARVAGDARPELVVQGEALVEQFAVVVEPVDEDALGVSEGGFELVAPTLERGPAGGRQVGPATQGVEGVVEPPGRRRGQRAVGSGHGGGSWHWWVARSPCGVLRRRRRASMPSVERMPEPCDGAQGVVCDVAPCRAQPRRARCQARRGRPSGPAPAPSRRPPPAPAPAPAPKRFPCSRHLVQILRRFCTRGLTPEMGRVEGAARARSGLSARGSSGALGRGLGGCRHGWRGFRRTGGEPVPQVRLGHEVPRA